MTALQSYMFEHDELAERPAGKSAFSLNAILSCLFVAFMFMLATNDPSATSRWEAVSRDEVANLSIAMESGRSTRQIAFMLLGGWGLVTFLINRRRFRLNGVFLYPLLVLTFLAFASLIWSNDRSFTAKRLVVFSCMMLGVLSFVRQFRVRDLALLAFLGCGIQLAASTVMDVLYATGDYGRSGYRFSGLQHPNHSGISAMLFIFATLYFFERTRKVRFLVLMGVAAILMYLTKSRTSLIAGLMAIAAFGVLRWERRTVMTLGICGAILFGLFFVMVSTGLVADDWSNVIHMGREDSQAAAFTGRPFIWAAALEWLGNDFSRLLLGAGYDSFWTPQTAEFVSNRIWFRISEGHCAYFDTLLELGIVGVLCYVFLVLASLLRYVYLARAKHSTAYAFAVMILMFAVVHGLTESTTVDPNFTTFFSFTAMTFLALRSPKVESTEIEVIE